MAAKAELKEIDQERDEIEAEVEADIESREADEPKEETKTEENWRKNVLTLNRPKPVKIPEGRYEVVYKKTGFKAYYNVFIGEVFKAKLEQSDPKIKSVRRVE